MLTLLTVAACLLRSVLLVDLLHLRPHSANVGKAVVNDPNKSLFNREQSEDPDEGLAFFADLERSLEVRAIRAPARAEVTSQDYAPAFFLPRNGSAARNRWMDVQALLRKLPFRIDPPDTVDQSANGGTVRYLCGAGNVEHLIFVHTDPTHRHERNLFRATLVGRPGVTVSDEAAKFGDIVQLPFFDHYRNLSLKFIYGMRWVMLYCPSVRSVVKVDDDVFLHPELLDAYLRNRLKPGDRRLHCPMLQRNEVVRNPHSRHYLSVLDYPYRYFPTHCSGWLVIIPAQAMRDLYVASFRRPVHAIDDAYVTGDLAKVASLKHVDITALVRTKEDQLLELVRGEYMCAYFTGRRTLTRRASLWKTLSYVKKRPDLDEAMQHTLKSFK
ncbi:hypothetical protein HPB48_004423 [Haemaphysalis longicornis]|uniref:Hexosyltransferase n=1 Tax=Haemaphysalis longicornis TaxID=44386 RepID=A0A9J6FZ30_HAELO|nr:hypothetical protein HPB48_004423 [Haemaphysalis longicornis]